MKRIIIIIAFRGHCFGETKNMPVSIISKHLYVETMPQKNFNWQLADKKKGPGNVCAWN